MVQNEHAFASLEEVEKIGLFFAGDFPRVVVHHEHVEVFGALGPQFGQRMGMGDRLEGHVRVVFEDLEELVGLVRVRAGHNEEPDFIRRKARRSREQGEQENGRDHEGMHSFHSQWS